MIPARMLVTVLVAVSGQLMWVRPRYMSACRIGSPPLESG